MEENSYLNVLPEIFQKRKESIGKTINKIKNKKCKRKFY